MVEALRHGEAHDIPSDEEVGAEPHLFNDRQFLLDAAIGRFVACPVAVCHPVESQLAQQLAVVIYVAREATFVFRTAVEVDPTFVEDAFGIGDKLGIKGVGGLEPFSGKQNLVGGGTSAGFEA